MPNSSLIIELILNQSSWKEDPQNWIKTRFWIIIEIKFFEESLGKRVPRVDSNNHLVFVKEMLVLEALEKA